MFESIANIEANKREKNLSCRRHLKLHVIVTFYALFAFIYTTIVYSSCFVLSLSLSLSISLRFYLKFLIAKAFGILSLLFAFGVYGIFFCVFVLFFICSILVLRCYSFLWFYFTKKNCLHNQILTHRIARRIWAPLDVLFAFCMCRLLLLLFFLTTFLKAQQKIQIWWNLKRKEKKKIVYKCTATNQFLFSTEK